MMIIYGIYDNDNHGMAMVMQHGALKMGIYIIYIMFSHT